jgi:lipopolysaccharide transport system ATP-binding protein
MSGKDIAIRLEGVSKLYRIGAREKVQDSLGATIIDILKSPMSNFRKYRSLYRFDDVDIENTDDFRSSASADIIWALKNVSFTVAHGEVLGIIGRNGAGKSTLLKILSKITPPTRGYATIRGRVASLLEVGTGFHQELTGRENVYLNGTILGMTKNEVDRKFDEIIDFSGVERFLDTPVKRYSSGMRVRLAFAVAAQLEPEILIIDEVLAVGDAAFQKKCLNKMESVSSQGRTVLFVSHNMQAIARLCPRAILLDAGLLVQDGRASQVVSSYMHSESGSTASRQWNDLHSAPGDEVVRLRAVKVRDEKGEITETFDIRHRFAIELEYDVLESGHLLMPNFNIFNSEGVHVFTTLDLDPKWRKVPRPPGRYVSKVWIDENLMTEGAFFVGAALMTPQPYIPHIYERDVVTFHIVDSLEEGSARGDWPGEIEGVIRPLLRWETHYDTNVSSKPAAN